MYSFNIENKFNLISFPKLGCTQVIKYVSDYLDYFSDHQHSYSNNNCKEFENIHNCGAKNFKLNINQPTFLVTRKIQDRVLSYYLSNNYFYKKVNGFHDPTFKEFVEHLNLFYSFDEHHLGFIYKNLKKYKIKNLNKLNLDNLEPTLNNLFQEFGIEFVFNKELIINKSIANEERVEIDYSTFKHSQLIQPFQRENFYNDDILKKIRKFYRKDLKNYI
jgi:hypothetical protein